MKFKCIWHYERIRRLWYYYQSYKIKSHGILLMTYMVHFTFDSVIDIQNHLLQIERIRPKVFLGLSWCHSEYKWRTNLETITFSCEINNTTTSSFKNKEKVKEKRKKEKKGERRWERRDGKKGGGRQGWGREVKRKSMVVVQTHFFYLRIHKPKF